MAAELLNKCKLCGISFSLKSRLEYYCKQRGKVRVYNICKQCNKLKLKQASYKRRKYFDDKKRKEVIKRGGKCSICGYDDLSCMAAFDFHHPDPKQKTGEVSSIIHNKGLTPKNIKVWQNEMSKCILICSNCHRKIHSKIHLI